MKKKKKKRSHSRSNHIEHFIFARYNKYSITKKNQLIEKYLKTPWSKLSGLELNKLILLGKSNQEICEHFQVSDHQVLDKIRR